MSTPGARSTDADASWAGGTSRGSSAGAEITTTRASPGDDLGQRPRARGGDLQVRRQAAIGSTS